MKTTRLARTTAASFLGIALGTTAFAEESDSGMLNRQAHSEVGVSPEKVASSVQLVSQITPVRNLIQVGWQDNNRWKIKLAAEIRKHLQVEAPDLVPGYDRMIFELAAAPNIENILERMCRDFDNATPEMRQRVVALVESRVSDLLPGLKGRIVEATAGIHQQLETRAPDLAPDYARALRELAAKPGPENLVDRLNDEWRGASPESRQRILRQSARIAGDLAPDIRALAGLATVEIRKHLDRRAPDLVTGYDEVLREVTSEPGIERAIGRLFGYWEQASPDLRARILVITGDMVAELIPEMEMLAGTAAAGIRERMETRSADLVPLYDKVLHELTSEPAIGNLVAQAGSEFRKTTPEMRGRIIELVGTMMIDLMIQIEKG